ncbi:MAG: NADP-dependent phosphogluconate dehydrogenase [Pseudomonadota bacterium]
MDVADGKTADVGLIGLGTMGAMLALNMAEKGFTVAVYNRTTSVTHEFMASAGDLAARLIACETIETLVSTLAPPRAVVLMVPAGKVVDDQIAALTPHLDDADLIVDAGNANFHDTNRRAAHARAGGIPFMGIGVSGGEEGARHGPAIMAGGTQDTFARMAPILNAIAAKYEGAPCAALMGPDGAGHFVKTVHNGIEYADMQIIAEAYGIMRDGLSYSAEACGEVFSKWNEGALKSYLIEISGKVATHLDPQSQKPMLDIIADRAGQKGTGRWTAIEAQHLGAPITVIEAAVAARNMSAQAQVRHAGESVFGRGSEPLAPGALSLGELEGALIAGKIVCYAQGFALIERASAEFGWALPTPTIAQVWREGCIIRSAMLNDMASALEAAPNTNLMFAPKFAAYLNAHIPALRKVAATAISASHPVPALSAAIGYFDTMRTARSTANMIQAQRDFFGAHGFERVDQPGKDHHGPWAFNG